jgi:hypothetical protein
MSVKMLSNKTSFKEGPGFVQFIIRGKIERWQEALLTAWIVAWTFIGVVVMREYYYSVEREMRMVLVIFLIFWAYYFWKVGRTWVFRLGGNELIRFEGDVLMLKRSFYTFGKTKRYYADIIKDLEVINLSKTSAAYVYENGWWVLGGEKLAFNYQGRSVKFAMQISDRDAADVFQILSKHIKRAKKLQN